MQLQYASSGFSFPLQSATRATLQFFRLLLNAWQQQYCTIGCAEKQLQKNTGGPVSCNVPFHPGAIIHLTGISFPRIEIGVAGQGNLSMYLYMLLTIKLWMQSILLRGAKYLTMPVQNA
jgi:hypothetical protein